MKPRSQLESLTTGALLLLSGTVACSLVVDTDPLQAGDKGLSCATTEKVCPDPNNVGRGQCVSTTNPAYGCTSNSCSACSVANAVPRCRSDGGCVISTCQGTHFDCNGKTEDGCEIDLSRDDQNCGGCGNVCKADHGVTTCASSACVIVYCAAPYDNCDQKYSNGCETDKSTSAANCGACGQACAKGLVCVSGACQAP